MKTIRHFIQPTCKIIQLHPKRRSSIQPIRRSFIQNVQHLIEENMEDENFGIMELCKAIGISRSQLHNKIKAATDLSTSIFIRNIRLEKAKLYLKSTDLNVSEIAYEVGFKDASYFSRLFVEYFGIAPSKISKEWS